MKRRTAVRTMSNFLETVKSRAALVIEDGSITDAEKKVLLNRLRREIMFDFSFYSPEREELDHFIKSEIKKSHRSAQGRTEVV